MSRNQTSSAMSKAIEIVQKSGMSRNLASPENDNRLVIYRQLLSLASESVRTASGLEFQATAARIKAQKALLEIQVRIELTEDELGISREDDCEHGDIDKHRVCLDCGKDLTEDLAAAAYDCAKAARQDG